MGIGFELKGELKHQLIHFLKENKSNFSTTTEDIQGIDVRIVSYQLNVDPSFKSEKKKRRKLGPNRAKVINNEVKQLVKVGSIGEVKYRDRLANTVIINKMNRKRMVCIDFTDQNKAWLNDSFPFSHIDRLTDATVGHKMLWIYSSDIKKSR